MAFTDILGEYASNRWDQATQPFTDPEAYLRDRLRMDEEERKRKEREEAARREAEAAAAQQKAVDEAQAQQVQQPVQPEPGQSVAQVPPGMASPNPYGSAIAQGATSEGPAPTQGGPAVPEQANIEEQRRLQQVQAQQQAQPVAPEPQAAPQPQAVQQPQPAAPTPVAPQPAAAIPNAAPAQAAPQMTMDERVAAAAQRAQERAGTATQLPQFGPGVQVASVEPGAGVAEAAKAAQPAPSPWAAKLEAGKNNLTAIGQILASDAPEDIKSEAQDRLLNMKLDREQQKKVEKIVTGVDRGDPKAVNELTRELKTRSEEGSLLKAVLYARLGLNKLADEEQMKLGGGTTYTSFTGPDNQSYTLRINGRGGIERAFDSSGKAVDENTLSQLNASYLSNKGLHYTGGSKVYTIPKGDANEGHEYTSRFATAGPNAGKFENIITTGPNAGKAYTGAPGLEKRVETSAAITENKAAASKGLIDYRLAQNLKYTGPMAYTRAGAAYVGKYNAENGTNLGYNRQGVLVDHNDDNKPVQQDKSGNISAVQRVEGKGEGAGQGAALETNLGQPPAYDPTLTPLQNKELQKNWAANRKKVTTDFITGKQGQTVQSMNVAIDHLDTLQQTANALGNGDIPLFNKIGNLYAKNTGDPAPTDFNSIKSIVGSEVAKAVAGGATALGDREEIRREIDSANSPKQLAGVISKYQQLLGGQLKGLRQTYESAGLTDFDKKLNPRTKEVLNKPEGAAPAATAGTQKTINGKTYVFDGKGWKPL